jgi:hypothetical protein
LHEEVLCCLELRQSFCGRHLVWLTGGKWGRRKKGKQVWDGGDRASSAGSCPLLHRTRRVSSTANAGFQEKF